MCPVCSAKAFETYEGQLDGVAYRSLRRTHRSYEYLCCLCRERRAALWDHCHEHGHASGPVCPTSNTFEGKGVAFLRRNGSALHLLRCRGCREAHSSEPLPPRRRPGPPGGGRAPRPSLPAPAAHLPHRVRTRRAPHHPAL
ncbi:endonuclease domain-containing protein [Streptomyces sp. NPDC059272]|uniref:endonuclease domain-containing protein n=1 Tax=Streptomyces sp. NPDC059272 TaxID=3346800 RepID=UPI0036B484BF